MPGQVHVNHFQISHGAFSQFLRECACMEDRHEKCECLAMGYVCLSCMMTPTFAVILQLQTFHDLS